MKSVTTAANRVIQLVEAAKVACKAETDTDLATCLRVSKQALSAWRAGRNFPDTAACGRIAELTGEPVARVLGIVGEAREHSEDARKVWRRLQQSAAALLMTVASLGGYSPTATAAARATAPHGSLFAVSVYYVRRWLVQSLSFA